MAYSFDGVNQYFEMPAGGPDISGGACSFLCRIKVPSGKQQDKFTWGFYNTVPAIAINVELQGTAAVQGMQLTIFFDTGNVNRYSLSDMTRDTWLSFIATWDGLTNATSIKFYFNGSEPASYFTLSSTKSGAQKATDGVSPAGAASGGGGAGEQMLAELCFKSGVASAAEIAAHAKGFHSIRPDVWVPAVRSLRDVRNGLAGTAYNSPTVVGHPRVHRPQQPHLIGA